MSDCDCYDNPPWWPSQLQGEPWRHIAAYGVTGADGAEADANAARLAAALMAAEPSEHWEPVPMSDAGIWTPLIAEYRRRFTDASIGDDGRVQFDSGGSMWLRALRFRVKPVRFADFSVGDMEVL